MTEEVITLNNKKEEVTTQISKEDIPILALAYDNQVKAVMNHNELAFKVFSWSTTLILATVGYILSQNKNFDFSERTLISIAIIILSIMTFWWQRQNYVETVEHGQCMETLHKIFHLTEAGYFGIKEPVFSRKFHAANAAARARLGVSPYNIVLLAMTIVGLIVLWRF